jgi:subtilisin family serine protease
MNIKPKPSLTKLMALLPHSQQRLIDKFCCYRINVLFLLAIMTINVYVNAQNNNRNLIQQNRLITAVQTLRTKSELMVRDDTFDQRVDELAQKLSLNGQLSIIVRLKVAYSPTDEVKGALEAQAQRAEIVRLQNAFLNNVSGYIAESVRTFDHLPLIALTVNSGSLDGIRSHPSVIDIQENKINKIVLAESTTRIGATTAWANGFTGSGYTVAIIDSGVDKTHPMIVGKVVAEACYSNSGGGGASVCPGGVSNSTATGSGVNCTGDSGCAHGTHVAGIAAGKTVTTSGLTFSGVARDANIIAIQVFTLFTGAGSCSGAATCIGAYDADIISGLNRVYALRSSYSITSVNMSLGGGRYYSDCNASESATKTAIDTLVAANIATIIASGNNGYKDSISSPACITTSVSVGATYDTSDSIALFSNSSNLLSLLAPGVSIRSAVPGSAYAVWDGTSMATPHVAGAWALIRQKASSYSVSNTLNALVSTGVSATDSNGITKTRINVNSALNSIVAQTVPSAPSSLSASVFSSSQINLSWTDNSNNETSFLIFRKTGAGGTYAQIATVGSNVTSYSNSGLSASTAYYYVVYASNSVGSSAASNEANGTTLASGGVGSARTTLSANRTYYVSTSGSNSSDGLTSGTPFATIQAAIDAVAALDISTKNVFISVGSGTFDGFALKDPVGAGIVIIDGSGSANTIIAASSKHAILANGTSKYQIRNMKLTTSGSGSAVWVGSNSYLVLSSGLEYGTCVGNHIESNLNSVVYVVSNYTVSGNGLSHWFADNGGTIIFAGLTMTLINNPSFSLSFGYASNLSNLRVNANTFNGSAQGVRYIVTNNAVIFAGGVTLPGTLSGSSALGGLYQ